jgi:hypothetical protein
MDFKTKVVDGKEIKYFTNDNGANIELVKIEPNEFGDWWGYSTIAVFINIYNDDFTKKVSFYVDNFDTGISGESWYDVENDKCERTPDTLKILKNFYEIKDSDISAICALCGNADKNVVTEIFEDYEDGDDGEAEDFVKDLTDEFSSNIIDFNDFKPQIIGVLSNFYKSKRTAISDLIEVFPDVRKSDIKETFETYEDDEEEDLEVTTEHVVNALLEKQIITEKDAWERTLDYYGVDDYYDAWANEKEFLNCFGKYNEEYDTNVNLLFDSMLNDDEVKKFCWCGHSNKLGGVCDFEVIPNEDIDYEWEGTYKDKKCRYVDVPVNVSLNRSGSERKVVKTMSIDTMFIDQYLMKLAPNNEDFKKYRIFVGEWVTTLWGCAIKGRLIGDYCVRGSDLPDWEGEPTFSLLRYWELTDVKEISLRDKEYTLFYSGERCWVIDREEYEKQIDFYPLFFVDVQEFPNEEIDIDGTISFPDGRVETISFSTEVTAVENNIIKHYYNQEEDMDYFPETLLAKLVNQLKLAYLDSVKNKQDAIKSVDELDAMGCKYSFPDIDGESE